MACTPLSITVFILMGLAALFWVVGVATDAMYTQTFGGGGFYVKTSLGLFHSSDVADWWKASQAMALLGLFALAGAGVVSLLTLCCKDIGRRIILILQAAALFVAAGCILLCVIIFGAEATTGSVPGFTAKLDYSYALICVSAALSAIAGVVCVVDMVKGE